MNSPLVSVVIPTYGRPEKLKKAIFSVFNQSYSKVEVVVVDDNPAGSLGRSETEVLIDSISCSKLKYVKRKCNGGGSLARNTGIKKSNGEFITFLDDDDFYLPKKIERQLGFMLARNLDLSLCSAYGVFEGARSPHKKIVARGINIKEFLICGNALTPMIMTKRELLINVGGFEDVPRFQDHILMYKLLAQHPNASVIDDPLYCAVSHYGERISYSKKSIQAYKIKHNYENKLIDNVPSESRCELIARQKLEKLRAEIAVLPLKDGFNLSLASAKEAKNVREVLACMLIVPKNQFSGIRFLRFVSYLRFRFYFWLKYGVVHIRDLSQGD